MEFADLLHEFLKEEGYKSHIQPHWKTPRWWTDSTCAKSITFGPPTIVRAVYLGMRRSDRIIFFMHPEDQRVFVGYEEPLVSGKMGRNRVSGVRYQYAGTTPVWKELGVLADPDLFLKVLDKLEFISRFKEYIEAGRHKKALRMVNQ
jgi:hypothetical protein